MGKTQFISFLPSFLNYSVVTFSSSIASQSVSAGASVMSVATTTVPTSSTVTVLKLNYSGIESFWRDFDSSLNLASPSFAAADYWYGSYYKFSGTTLTVTTYFLNPNAGSKTIPDVTINISARLYVAPF